MRKSLHAYSQYLIPQHLLSRFAGILASTKTPWLKDWIIRRFIRVYKIDMNEALISDPAAYANFNHFFIRKLKPDLRPINFEKNIIASPADGAIAQLGKINKDQLLQAKGFDFTLAGLLGNDKLAASYFQDGSYATIYLAPNNYHRVHMPIDGRLVKSIFVPGKLFSVNQVTAQHIPQLYSRNERLITIYDTDIGKMAVILVGAMIVGSIQTSWMDQPVRGKKISSVHFTQPLTFKKGDEIGHFLLGSTVIILFEKNKVEWDARLKSEETVMFGEGIARIQE